MISDQLSAISGYENEIRKATPFGAAFLIRKDNPSYLRQTTQMTTGAPKSALTVEMGNG